LTLEDKTQNDQCKEIKSNRGLLFRVGTFFIRCVFHINGGLEVKGIENIPTKGGVIVASNHLSYLDPPLIASVLPRRATFMARRGLFNIPLLGWLIRHYAFPVDREKTHPSTIKEALRRLKDGEVLVIFPEGQRSKTGRLLEGKPGIGMIARIAGAPVIPTLIIGSDKALPVGAKWLRRAKISVIFGMPLTPLAIDEEGNNYKGISQKIMNLIGELKNCYADNSG